MVELSAIDENSHLSKISEGINGKERVMLLFNLITKQKEIAAIDYWEMGILDLKISYFGDEVSLCIEDYHNKEKYWEIKFLVCAKVEYSNDVLDIQWRKDQHVKDMTRGELHHHGQEISLQVYENNPDFVECMVDIGLLQMTIVCRDIQIEHLELKDAQFFWQDNEVFK